MSASSRPTVAPAWASATARLTLTVLLPTPPLPEPTAITFLTFGQDLLGLLRRRPADHRAPGDRRRRVAPIAAAPLRVLPSISSLSGQAGVVSSIVNATLAPSIAMYLTMFEGDDVASELRFLDLAEGVEDGAFGERRHRSSNLKEPSGISAGSASISTSYRDSPIERPAGPDFSA